MVAQRSVEQIDDDFHLSDIMFFTKSGLEVKTKLRTYHLDYVGLSRSH